MSAPLPHELGCGALSANARTPPVSYAPGLYSVVVQAGAVWDQSLAGNTGRSSGRYVLGMQCEHPGQTVAIPTEQLGLKVDPESGAVAATPRAPGRYTFNLTAVDAGGTRATATIREWSIDVIHRPVFRRSAESFQYTPMLTDLPVLVRSWTYTAVPPPFSESSTYFENVTGPLVFSVVYGSDNAVDLGEDLLMSPQSGLIRLVPSQFGDFTAYVVASDGSRRVNVTYPWHFRVLPDTDPYFDALGPNGRGCGNGTKRQSASHNGSYLCDCTGTNMTGLNCNTPIPLSESQVGGSDSQQRNTLIAILTVLVFTLIVVAAVLMRERARQPQDLRVELRRILELAGNISEDVVAKFPKELSRRAITLGDRRGEGEFGDVYQATLRNHGDVAVKTIRNMTSDENRLEFVKEAVFASNFDHTNICKVLGMVTIGTPSLIVLELCSHGSLKSYLEELGNRPDRMLLLQFLKGITSGMAYLAERRFVHRDLAARNVLVNEARDVKIAEFGMTRRIPEDFEFYQLSETDSDKVATLWTDPLIFDWADTRQPLQFSERTDVWAFGITAIEVFNGAQRPYSNFTVQSAVQAVRRNYRHPRPSWCPEQIYSGVIKPCWDEHDIRPTFSQLYARVDECIFTPLLDAHPGSVETGRVESRSTANVPEGGVRKARSPTAPKDTGIAYETVTDAQPVATANDDSIPEGYTGVRVARSSTIPEDTGISYDTVTDVPPGVTLNNNSFPEGYTGVHEARSPQLRGAPLLCTPNIGAPPNGYTGVWAAESTPSNQQEAREEFPHESALPYTKMRSPVKRQPNTSQLQDCAIADPYTEVWNPTSPPVWVQPVDPRSATFDKDITLNPTHPVVDSWDEPNYPSEVCGTTPTLDAPLGENFVGGTRHSRAQIDPDFDDENSSLRQTATTHAHRPHDFVLTSTVEFSNITDL